MTKISDLDEDLQQAEENLLETKASELGLDKWESTSGGSTLLEAMIGLCAKCKVMRYCKTEFGDVLAFCQMFKIRLHGQNKIVDCNEYNPRGTMSLKDMENIAILINQSEPEIKGFISRDRKLMKEKK
jgi:hypothetical protein